MADVNKVIDRLAEQVAALVRENAIQYAELEGLREALTAQESEKE